MEHDEYCLQRMYVDCPCICAELENITDARSFTDEIAKLPNVLLL